MARILIIKFANPEKKEVMPQKESKLYLNKAN